MKVIDLLNMAANDKADVYKTYFMFGNEKHNLYRFFDSYVLDFTSLNFEIEIIDEIVKLEENYDLDGICQDCIYLEKIKPLFEEKDKEITRLYKRNEEVYKEVRDYAYSLCITSDDKVIARRIIEHLATYLLFNTPIRKSDPNDNK